MLQINFLSSLGNIVKPYVFLHWLGSLFSQKEHCYCLISINHQNAMANLVELNIVDFDGILGMYWFHACYASIDCRTQVLKFNVPNEPVIELNGSSLVPNGCFISYLKVRKFGRCYTSKIQVPSLKPHLRNNV